MRKKRGRGGIIIIFILLMVLVAALYFLYLTVTDIYAEPIKFRVDKIASKNQSSFTLDFQFYPNMRFPDKTITYNIDTSCNENKITNIGLALNQLEQETGLLKFVLSQKQNTEIFFSCSESEIQIEEKYFIAGEGGPTSIVNTSLFYVIQEGKVLLFYETPQCKNHNVELHEILHVLGFQHSENKESIMYPTTFCNQVLTNDMVDDLKALYSMPPLPDLYFFNIDAIKHGHYLDFNVTIKNQGLKEARNVVLELNAEDKKIEEFDIKEMDYGEGSILTVTDLTIPRNTEKISFTIVADEELDKENNDISLYLQQ